MAWRITTQSRLQEIVFPLITKARSPGAARMATPRGVFKCRAHLLSPMAHARGIKMILRETAHTLKDTRHFCSTPVHLPVARLSLVAPEHSLIRQRTGPRTNGRATRSRTLIAVPNVTCLDPTSFPTHQILLPIIIIPIETYASI